MRYYKFFRHGSCSDDGSGLWEWVLIDVQEDLKALRDRFQNKDIYLTVQTYDQTQVSVINNAERISYALSQQSNAPHVSPLFFDLDHENADIARLDAMKVVDYLITDMTVPEDAVKIYFSGKKGFHILVDHAYLGISPRVDWHGIFKLFTKDVSQHLELQTWDHSVYSKRRMLRVPDSMHAETGLFKIELARDELSLSIDELRKLAVKPRGKLKTPKEVFECQILRDTLDSYIRQYEAEEANKRTSVDFDPSGIIAKNPAPACIIHLLENGIWKYGDRNKATLSLASYYKCAGVPLDQAIKDTVVWATTKIRPALSSTKGRRLHLNTKSVVESVYASNDYTFKCPFMLSLGDKTSRIRCDGKECFLHDSNVRKYNPAIEVPLVDATNAQHHGKKIKTKVIVSMAPMIPLMIPIKFRFSCSHCSTCENKGCGLINGGPKVRRLDASDKDVLVLCHTPSTSFKHKLAGSMNTGGCVKFHMEELENMNVHDLTVATTVERPNYFSKKSDVSNDETKYASVMVYFLSNERPDFNKRYIVEGYLFAHPKDNRSVLLVDSFTQDSTDLEKFELTPEVRRQFDMFRPKRQTAAAIKEKLEEIIAKLSSESLKICARQEITTAICLTYHSVLRYRFLDRMMPRGWMEIMLMGDSGEGKSYAVKVFMDHVKLGLVASGETSKRTGLIYSLENINNRWFVRWGDYINMDRQILAIDEAGEMSTEDLSQMTDARTTGVITVKKVATAEALCRTRLIFMSNPRSGRQLNTFSHQIEAVNEVFGSTADVRRLDLALLVDKYDIDQKEMNKRIRSTDTETYPTEIMRNSILWTWTRTADHVIITREAEDKILECSIKLWAKYAHDRIELISKGDTKEKLARMSIAMAALMKSTTDDDTKILVTPPYVEAVYEYICKIYDDYGLGMASHVCRKKNADMEVNRNPGESKHEFNTRRGQQAYTTLYAMAKKSLHDDTETITLLFDAMLKLEHYSIQDMCNILGIEKKDMGAFFRSMIAASYIQYGHGKGAKDLYIPTPKLKNAMRYMIQQEMTVTLESVNMVEATKEERETKSEGMRIADGEPIDDGEPLIE